MTILSQSPEKNFHFFYRSRKVPSAVSGIFQNEKKVTPCPQNFRSHMPQKKYQTHSLKFEKSQKIILFEDFISKNVLRTNLYCEVYISFGFKIFESLREGCLPEIISLHGACTHAIFEDHKSSEMTA